MRISVGRRRILGIGLAVAVAAVCRAPAAAAEPFEAFLEGLRRRQMYDMAQTYLDSMQSSNRIPAELKKTIPYEQARTLIEESRTLRDTGLRMKRLDEAKGKFEAFIQANPEHPLAGTARTQLGNILLERGRTQLELSKRPSQAARKEQLVAEARELLKRSQEVFDSSEAKYAEQLKAFPKAIDPKDKEQLEARESTRLNLLQARLFSATVLYEAAQAYDRGGEQWKKMLTDGAQRFGAIYRANEKIIAGLFARMWQGRCLQELGDLTEATTYYDQLLVQPDSDDFRDLKRKTLRYALECWTDDKLRKFDQAIQQGEAWLKQARGQEDLTVEGLAIHWLIAVAYEKQAAALEGAEKDRALRNSAEHAAHVARYPGEFQNVARELVAKYRKIERQTEPNNFADARVRAKNELDAMIVADGSIKAAQETKKDAEKIPQWEQERQRALEAAMKYYRLALSLRNREIPIEQVNDCRYYLCFLNYDDARYLDAAVIGEFVARNYPDASVARPCAKIAMAAYLQAYNTAPAEDRAFETARMVGIAEYIASKWPLEAEADEAWMILGDVAIRAQDLAKAADYLNRVRPESPRRGEADLKAGQAMWGAYQTASRLPAEQRPAQAELDKMVADAREVLQRGVQRMRDSLEAGGELTYTLLAAELALAQVQIDTGKPDEAISILERPETGVLALVAGNNPLTQRGTFATEAYKAALRAYAATQRLPDAERTMDALDKQVAGSQDAAATLTRVYVGLGLELEAQLARLREEKKTEDLQRVARGFDLFLDRIAARQAGNTFTSLNWVADTYYRLGEGIGVGSDVTQSQGYYKKSADTYQQLLERGQKEQGFLSPAAKSTVRLRLARCERALGHYAQAIEQIAAILAANPNTLEAQIAAAETYQHWGQAEPAYFEQAINGRPATPSDKGDIWGWNRLALRLQKLPKYEELYRQARYNVADCMYQMALRRADKEKTDGLNKAAALIEAMARIDPKMGGDAWRQKYDRLLKDIQRAAGRKPDGLTGFAPANASANAAKAPR